MIQPLNNVAGCIQKDSCVRVCGAKESPLEHVPKIPAAAGAAQHGANECAGMTFTFQFAISGPAPSCGAMLIPHGAYLTG